MSTSFRRRCRVRRLMPISAAICFLFLAGVWGCWDVDDEKNERIINFFVVSVSDGMLNSQPVLRFENELLSASTAGIAYRHGTKVRRHPAEKNNTFLRSFRFFKIAIRPNTDPPKGCWSRKSQPAGPSRREAEARGYSVFGANSKEIVVKMAFLTKKQGQGAGRAFARDGFREGPGFL